MVDEDRGGIVLMDGETGRTSMASAEPGLSHRKASRHKGLKTKTILSMRRVLWDLVQVGEISNPLVMDYGLSDSHILMLGRSGLVAITPWALVVTPRLLSVMPVANEKELLEKLDLPAGDDAHERQAWSSIDEWAESVDERYEDLSYDYIEAAGATYCGAFSDPCRLHQNHILRPTFLYPYVPLWVSVDDWKLDELDRLPPVFKDHNYHVFSTLGIRTYHDLEIEIWGNPFYWLALQLLILSDQETGAAYEHKITLHLSRRWDDPGVESGAVNICFAGTPVYDFLSLLNDVLPRLRCVWVNRAGQAEESRAQVMTVFKLLAKAGILERQPNGQLGLTAAYRRKLFEGDSFVRWHYYSSRDFRDEIREIIKGMADHANVEVNLWS